MESIYGADGALRLHEFVAGYNGRRPIKDADTIGSTPTHIPTYTVADLTGDYTIAGHLRILGGISNLANRHYYSRVFLFGGMLEPANDRVFHACAAYDL